MIYYDRRIAPELLSLIQPGGALAWLVEYVRKDASSRLDFRRDEGNRRGALQFYLGRTSPLEVQLGTRGVRFSAHAEYVKVTPSLFAAVVPFADLESQEPTLRAHLGACASSASCSFTDGEAAAHNGMMRRYALDHRAGDPFLAGDSEVRLGFRASAEHATGTARRTAHEQQLREVLQLPTGADLPRKLDAIGVLPGGEIALVEVKDEHGDIGRAAWQAVAHVHTFTALMAQPDYDLLAVLNGMIDQKATCGLLPAGTTVRAMKRDLVPVVAAPDSRPDWRTVWMDQAGPVLDRRAGLAGCRFWRLSPDGVIKDEFRV